MSAQRIDRLARSSTWHSSDIRRAHQAVMKSVILYGYGFANKARFLPGHDARLHSIVLRIHRGKANRDELTDAPETLDYLKTAPWMTEEIAESIKLHLH